MDKFLEKLGIKEDDFIVYNDTQIVIHSCKTPSHLTHIDVLYH